MTTPQPPTDLQLAAYVGPGWEKVYRRKFERFRQDPGSRFMPSWNWRAALLPAWFLLHRLYVPFAALLACFIIAANAGSRTSAAAWSDAWFGLTAYVLLYPLILPVLLVAAVTEPGAATIGHAAVALAFSAVQGVIADWLLYRKALASASAARPVRAVRPGSLPAAATVIVVIALVPLFRLAYENVSDLNTGFASTREHAYAAEMKSDLRNLVTAEESYFTDHQTYTATLSRLSHSASADTTIVITSASRTGWAATAKRSGTTSTCGIYVGTATPPISGQNEGEPKCQ